LPMDNERFVDRNEALTIFQVSAHQFHRWTKIGRPWHVRKQGYPVKAIAVWIWNATVFLAWWISNVHEPGDERDDSTREAKRRYWLARSERERLQVEQLHKKLIPTDDVEKAFTDRAYELRGRLLLLSRRVAGRVAGTSQTALREVTETIDDEVIRMMTEYSRDIEIEHEALK